MILSHKSGLSFLHIFLFIHFRFFLFLLYICNVRWVSMLWLFFFFVNNPFLLINFNGFLFFYIGHWSFSISLVHLFNLLFIFRFAYLLDWLLYLLSFKPQSSLNHCNISLNLHLLSNKKLYLYLAGGSDPSRIWEVDYFLSFFLK